MTRRDISEQIDAIFARKGGYRDGGIDSGFQAPPLSKEAEEKIERLLKAQTAKGFGKK